MINFSVNGTGSVAVTFATMDEDVTVNAPVQTWKGESHADAAARVYAEGAARWASKSGREANEHYAAMLANVRVWGSE